jgi:hypothetical protein
VRTTHKRLGSRLTNSSILQEGRCKVLNTNAIKDKLDEVVTGFISDETRQKLFKKMTEKSSAISTKIPEAASAVLHRKQSRSEKIMMGATKSAQVVGFITATVLSFRLIVRRMRNGG